MNQLKLVIAMLFISLNSSAFDTYTITPDTSTGHVYQIVKKVSEDNKIVISIARSNKDGVYSNYHTIHGLNEPKRFKIDNGIIHILDNNIEKNYKLSSSKNLLTRTIPSSMNWITFNETSN